MYTTSIEISLLIHSNLIVSTINFAKSASKRIAMRLEK